MNPMTDAQGRNPAGPVVEGPLPEDGATPESPAAGEAAGFPPAGSAGGAAGPATGAASPSPPHDEASGQGEPEVTAAGTAAPETAGPGAEEPAGVPPCPGGQAVQVRPGDTLFLLAQRHGVPLAAVILANPQLVDPGRIVPGQWICIPSAPPGCPGGRLVVVRPGDSLSAIGQRHGVPVEAMIAANPQLADPDRIVPGQIVCVPRAPSSCAGSLYVVEPGDTLQAIAGRFGVTLEALVAANPQITNPDRIRPGEVVCVPSTAGD